ncbi:MAG: hypothetical protein IJR67_05275 [Acholeplasmatales bacterium]|nr:hypothetical protein [Acholeplasmatales bacterium]
MQTMDIFEDYDSFRREYFELIKKLVEKKSKTIQRFAPVFLVVNYLYEKNQKKKLTEDEYVFFSTGFDYIFDEFHMINTLYELKFNKDIDELEKYSQTINLLLYVNEFQSEAKNYDFISSDDLAELNNLENKINEYIDNKKNAPDEYFVMLNEIVDNIFSKNDIELHTIDEIFYEIAVEYGIYEEDDFNLYNKVLNDKLNQKDKESR